MSSNSTVRIVGGLFPAQLVERIASGDSAVPGTAPADYHFDTATELNQGINRAWTALSGRWAAYKAARALLPAGDRATTLTRDRWLLPLLQELGYGRLQPERTALEADGRAFALSHRWGRVPIHLVGAGISLDKRIPGERGAAASAPHALVQDFLNHDDNHLWAFVSNGLELRILRDHHSLTQQAYVTFDLETLFDGEQFSAFRLLYLLCHVSRVEGDDPRKCRLEQWVTLAREDGVRALDRLRAGVEVALAKLGSGFVAHRGNTALRARLSSGALSTQDLYRQLLRLVYRLLFLFVAEDRDLLLVPDAPDAAKDRYRRLYTTRRLRSLALRRRGSPHDDAWQALRLVMRHLDRGCPELALPALGSFLWGSELRDGQRVSRALPDLDEALLDNEHLYAALGALCAVQDGVVRRPVDWAGVQSDELGSVYEALMEKVPRVNAAAGTFELADAAGNERKTTGSYYTPSSLVDCLLDSALDPVLEEAARKPDPETAILELSVVDPACGSGHFLVSAARRIARRLARVRSGGIEPSPPEVQHALRDVVGRCIYGVDLNPMAVELCKVSIWMEAMEPGRPLSFLDAHIQHGNALLGTTPELMAKGIPDEAWDAIEGDDKKVASALKKRNKKHAAEEQLAWSFVTSTSGQEVGAVANAVADLEAEPDASPEGVARKESRWERLLGSPEYRHEKFVADAWCSAFVWPKNPGASSEAAPTNDLWRQIRNGAANTPAVTSRSVDTLAAQYNFFHWHLQFPRVTSKGGFDVVLGNPPYVSALERVSPQDTRSGALLGSRFRSAAGAYDLYVPFLELAGSLTRQNGRAALLTPNKYLAAPYGEALRNELLSRSNLIEIADVSTSAAFADASVYPIVTTLSGSPVSNSKPVVTRVPGQGVSTEHPRRSLGLLPENNWGFLLSRAADIVHRAYDKCRPLGVLLDVCASTTAAEADAFTVALVDGDERAPYGSWRTVNTGTIDPFVALWGVQPMRHARKSYMRPWLSSQTSIVGERRRRQYSTPKIIFAKLASEFEAMVDIEGQFAALNVNFAIGRPESTDELYYYAAFLNSGISSWLYRQLFGALGMGGGYLQYQAPQLRVQPVVPFEKSNGHCVELARLGRLVCESSSSPLELAAAMNEVTCDLLGLSELDKARVASSSMVRPSREDGKGIGVPTNPSERPQPDVVSASSVALEPPPASSGVSHGVFTAEGTPSDYAEALRMGLLFTLILRSGEAGISQGSLSRALLWLEDGRHAATGLLGTALANFERVRESEPLLAQGSSSAPRLLQALDIERVITRDTKGIVRLRAGSMIPSWLPQTPTLAELASVMRAGLEQAETGASTTPTVEMVKTKKAKRA